MTMTMKIGGSCTSSSQCCTACGKGPRTDKKNKPLRLHSCSRCKSVWYHDADCQTKDWPRHKQECKQLQQLRQRQQQRVPTRERASTTSTTAPPPHHQKVTPNPRRQRRRSSSGRRSIPSFQASKCKKYARWYHKMAEQHRLGSITELNNSMHDIDRSAPEEEQQEETKSNNSDTRTATKSHSKVQQAKAQILSELNRTMGETVTDIIHTSLETLLSHYDSTQFDPRRNPTRLMTPQSRDKPQISMEGIGVSAGKPAFPGCIGKND